MKKILAAIALCFASFNSAAQFAPHEVLTAAALNAALANPTITGGSINGTPIGTISPAPGNFTTLSATSFVFGTATFSNVTVNGLTASTIVSNNGSKQLISYAGTSCTNQVVRALSAGGAATCVSPTSAYVSGTTGSGNFVLATSPTIATPAITGAATVSGGVDKLTTASGVVSVAAATAPSVGQALVATSSTVATWQTVGLGTYLPLAGGTMTGNLLFTDATYDIGASGATRPRHYYGSGNVTTGGAAAITGAGTFGGGVDKLTTATGVVSVAAATAPSSGQVLRATSATVATWQTPPFGASYTSAQQTITAAGSLTLAHGLGSKPYVILAVLHCVTGESNYTAGDELSFFVNGGTLDSNNSRNGVSVVADATNLNIRFASGTNMFTILDKTTGAIAAATNANWTVIFKAFN